MLEILISRVFQQAEPFIRSNEQVQLSAVELFVFGNDIVFLMRLN
jgi:hypothetical protein